MSTINLWSVLASAVVGMIVGSIWYGPLFGKKYISAMGMDKKSPEEQAAMKKGMMMLYVWQFIASIVMFYVLAWFIFSLGQNTAMGGITVALMAWVGFVVPLKLGESLWGGKMSLFWIGIGGNLITMVLVGAILGAWH